MPANLPPEYFGAEKTFKQATTPQEKISALEALIATIPKHKGTDKLRGDLRRKLSKLREETTRKKKAGRGDLYTIEKQGAAQVSLMGFPNSGKSSILKTLTNASPVIADYPVSSVLPLSGMMTFEDIQFQLVDLPPIGNESTDGWVSGILRIADVLMLVIDLSKDPDSQVKLLLEQLREWKIPITNRVEGTEGKGDLIYKPVILAANKSDLSGAEDRLKELRQRYGTRYPVVSVSTIHNKGIEKLRTMVFESSHIIRVYAKEPGKEPDIDTPFTLPQGSAVLDLAELIHKDFVKNLKYSCIWGSTKFDGQRVQKDYVLHDRDVVEYHL